MAQPQIGHVTLTVGTDPILLWQAPTNEGLVDVIIHNEGGSKVFLGGDDVATSGGLEGFSLNNGTHINFNVAGGTQIYAVSASSSKVCLLYSV